MSNPFADWKPAQQCRHRSAEDASGVFQPSTSMSAVRWCASGWMNRKQLSDQQQDDFDEFLADHHFSTSVELNDFGRWTPAQFAAAWDEFEKERA